MGQACLPFLGGTRTKKIVLLNCIMGTAARLLKLHKGKNSGELIQNLKERYTHKDTPDLALSKWAFKNSLIGLQISP